MFTINGMTFRAPRCIMDLLVYLPHYTVCAGHKNTNYENQNKYFVSFGALLLRSYSVFTLVKRPQSTKRHYF